MQYGKMYEKFEKNYPFLKPIILKQYFFERR
jgi:hypothetical protein